MSNPLINIQKEALEEVRHGLNHDIFACNTRALQFLDLIDSEDGLDKYQKFQDYLPYLKATLREAQIKSESINAILRLKLEPLPDNTISPQYVLDAVMADIQLKYPDRNIDVSGTCGLETFYIKEEQLKFILTELIENAIIHNVQDDTMSISVTLEDTSEHTVIIVQDTGIGFDAESQDVMLKLFAKSTPTKLDDIHFGIGLSLVKFIAADMVGRLRLNPSRIVIQFK